MEMPDETRFIGCGTGRCGTASLVKLIAGCEDDVCSLKTVCLERNGVYWGPPSDDATAIRELDRLRQNGAQFIVFAWTAFWYLNYYAGLRAHLRSNYRCLIENDHIVCFDLKSADFSAFGIGLHEKAGIG